MIKKLNINVIFVSIIAIFVSLILNKTQNTNNTISVSGECSKKITKDKFKITLTIKNIDNNVKNSIKKTLATYNQITLDLKKIKEENSDIEFETTEYTTKEKTQWDNQTKNNKIIGMESVISIVISTSKPELLSNIIFNTSKYNDILTSRLESFVSKELFLKETNDCLEIAVKDAQNQANKMANSVNQKIGKMIYANYKNNTNSDNMLKTARYSSYMNNDAELYPAEIFTGSEDVSVLIYATFELK